MKILFLSNHYNTLRIFRRELIMELAALNHEVIVVMPPCEKENIEILKSYGCKIKTIALERRSMNPIQDIILLNSYHNFIKNIKPDKVITYTIKPNVYGSIACRLLKVPHYVNITGLGSIFYSGLYKKVFAMILYKLSINRADKVFFENTGDRNFFVNNKIIKAEQSVILNGAGVNLEEFGFCEYPNDSIIRFLFVGRIMREKGVNELFKAVIRIKKQYKNVEFDFIGWYEDNYKELVERLQQKGFISFHGFHPDVRPFIQKAHCVILPSWHEGMSNTLLEGAAMCRPLITNDISGCKEAVINEVTGYLCVLQDVDSLYNAIKTFIKLPQYKKEKMGLEARKYMKKKFDKQKVVRETIEEIMAHR